MASSLIFKCVIIGDSGSGKSCLVEKLVKDNFEKEILPTIGVEYYIKNYYLNNDKYRKLQIWCTSGDKRFKNIIKEYFKNCICAIIVYDITNKISFKNVNYWLDEFKKENDTENIFLIGNKKDLEEIRSVSYEEGKSLNFIFEETSAKTGENISDFFKKIVEKLDTDYDLYKDKKNIKGVKIEYNIKEKKNRICGFFW